MEAVKKRKFVVYKFDRFSARAEHELVELYSLFLAIGSFVLSLFYPSLGAALLGLSLTLYYKYYKEFFISPAREEFYRRILSPRAASSHFVTIGYEVPEKDLPKHLYYLDLLDSEQDRKTATRYLALREKRSKNGAFWEQVGLSKKQLTTHFWVLGTTGAGKTSFIMTLIQKTIEAGGGCIFVDGKADEKMFAKLYNIAVQAGRENDVYLVNFLGLEGEAREHTNTFNPLAGAPPEQIVEFLMSLLGEPSGDQAYWQSRGRAMLSPIVFFLKFRETYYGERFTFSVLADFVGDVNKYLLMCGVLATFCQIWENKFNADVSLRPLIQKARRAKGITDPQFPAFDSLIYYYTINPSEKTDLFVRGYDFNYLSDLWKAYQIASIYVKTLAQENVEILRKVSDILIDESEKKKLDLNALSWNEIVELFLEGVAERKRRSEERRRQRAWQRSMRGAQDFQNFQDFQEEQDDFDVFKRFTENPHAIQQHYYAQQQWTQIIITFTTYSHVFDTLYPEVDVLDVLKNQKILYVLLPPLKQSADTTKLLGRIVLTALRFAVSKALGGYVENLTDKEKAIITSMITPRPLGLCVFDEYGSYPISGIDTFLAQVRSINVSVVLSTQDYTSARVDGKDENAVRRAWANTQKLILRVKDNETLKAIEEALPKTRELTESYLEADFGRYVTKAETSVSDLKPSFNVQQLVGFKNGLGLLLTDEEPIIVQIYWADAPAAHKTQLNHYSSYAALKTT